jgi:hypothetical protein
MECIACFEPNATYEIVCGSPVVHALCDDCEIDWRLTMKYSYDHGFPLKCPMCRIDETELNPARSTKSMQCELAMMRHVRKNADHPRDLCDRMPKCKTIRAKTYPKPTAAIFSRFARMKTNIMRDIVVRRHRVLQPPVQPPVPPVQQVVMPPHWLASVIASIWADHERALAVAPVAPVAPVARVLPWTAPRPRRVKCESGKPCTTRSRTQRKCDQCDKRVCRSCKECLTHS